MRVRLTLCCILVAIACLYWTGLDGPYLLDDFAVLSPVESWYAGRQGWLATLLPNADSVIFSRPVAMASFMLTTWIGGTGTFPLKAGNLVVHLLCGLLGWWLLRRLLRLDTRLSPNADLIAVIAAGVWLLHPLHVSTVLYAVQRMAQLAALFTLAAVAIYLVARQQLTNNRKPLALLSLFVAFPVLMALGLLSKQNAAIAGVLCLVVEIAYFRHSPRPRALQGFFGLFVALPAMAVLLILTLAPDRLLSGYAEWDFTLRQRLLTQPRVLFDYIGMWFLPRGPEMGLYTDAYVVSTGILSPPSTLMAITGLGAVSTFAFAMRRNAPSIFCGWFFFLVGHAVESSFLPIEMYYEHRNYLPAFGLLLMAFGLLGLVPDTTWARMANPRRLGIIAASAIALTLAFATLGRVLVWQDSETIIAQGIEQHPESLRARMNLAALAVLMEDYEKAKETVLPLTSSDHARQRVIGHLYLVTLGCLDGAGANHEHLSNAVSDARNRITIYEFQMATALVNNARPGACGSVTPGMIGSALAQIAETATEQGENTTTKYALRTIAARLHARSKDWKSAEAQAEIAWHNSHHLPVAALLTSIYLKTGKIDEARVVFSELERRARPFDRFAQRDISRLRMMIESHEEDPTIQ